MKFRNYLIMIGLISLKALASGGDDSGNGGFAYKQSDKILEMASKDLEHKIIESNLKELNEHPDRRLILQVSLSYDHLQKLPKKNAYRSRKKLAMDYVVNPPTVKILKPYYEAFMGKTDEELEQSSLEVQKRLLHEASHIWGLNEEDSEAFALRFLDNTKVGEKRPTNQIDIKDDFCSCINGKSDSLGQCDSFCASVPETSVPILYLNTVMGPDILSNPRLGNLYNWCNAQLDGDVTGPQCFLSATDGVNVIDYIPVTINRNSNSLSANINQLPFNKTYILKIVEGKTGSNAQSREFQLKRLKQRSPGDSLGALRITPINQYSCLIYGGVLDGNGKIQRTSYVRNYYYFTPNETPMPVPPAGGEGNSLIVCHDDQLHPGNDNIVYPRLETIPQLTAMWDKTDIRFISDGVQLKINKLLTERLYTEYGVRANLDLFKLIQFPSAPTSSSTTSSYTSLGFMMVPFVNVDGKAFCPTHIDYNGEEPLFNLLKDYMDDTEGLYLAEKEAETIQDGNTYKMIYGTMFVTQSTLMKYGFYIENGLKVQATEDSLHTKTIHFYWPTTDAMDPLIQGQRKLFTVKTSDSLNGNTPTGASTTIRTSDKRIGCVHKI
ncbi:MAG: hypothetical protein ACXVLQ_10130 [Bacteriovorax sp.]